MTGEETEEGVKPCLLYSNPQQAQFRRGVERLSDMEPQNTHHVYTHMHMYRFKAHEDEAEESFRKMSFQSTAWLLQLLLLKAAS